MRKLEYFSIILQKPDEEAIYFPGENLIGILTFRVLERFKINSVRMIIDGSCRVKWVEGKGSKSPREYKAKENYIREIITFIEKDDDIDANRSSGSDGDSLYLDPGQYSFPFNFVLPINLPTSFEHKYGRIRYSLNGVIDIPWAFDSHTTRAFSVVNHFDLNRLPELRIPKSVSDLKVLCCGPWKSDPIFVEFSIEKTGYVPGEVIKCRASLDNHSKNEFRPMKVSLVQHIEFHGERFTHHTKQVKREVTSTSQETYIGARSHDDWSHIELAIPPVCATTSDLAPHSALIVINYAVVLTVDAVTLFHSKKELVIPITIGTVPLWDQSGVYGATTAAMASTRGGGEPPPYSFRASVFDQADFDEPPPEYDDICGSGGADIVESNAATFRPHYPYFASLNSTC